MIVIVGAGLAGLSAACRLIESGHRDMVIIEAKHRAGGRIESLYYQDGSRIDMGAQWLHGEKTNPIYDWLKGMNLIEQLEDDELELEGLFRTQFGEEPPKDVVFKVLELLMDAKQILYKMSAMMDTSCRPVDLYRKHIKLESQNCPLLKSADPHLIEAVLRWFELYETIDNSCEQISLLSLKAYSNWTDFDEGRMVKLKGGWHNVVTKLMEIIGKDRFLFGCPVERLSYSSKGVKVTHANGVVDCNHVIVTFSIGVMKSLEPNFFEPPLSDRWHNNVKCLGFGVVDKIFLQFDRPYLHKERGLKLLWMKGQTTTNASLQNSKLPQWTRFVTGFDLVSDAPNFLLSWVGGEGAKMMEQHSEQEIGDTCLEILRTFLPPDKQPPKLISVSRSTWATDPYIRGSYSYESTLALNLDIETLWEPICWQDNRSATTNSSDKKIPRIQFAGEATAASLYATAHGAIASGWREADRLSQFLAV